MSSIQSEMLENIPKSLKKMLKSIQFLDPSRTFPIEMNPKIFGHDEDLYIALEDIIHLSTMDEIEAPCVVLYIRLAIFSLFTLHAQNNI